MSVRASQDDLPHARRHAAHDAGDHFVAFDLAHDSCRSAPDQPGMVSGSDDLGESWILVRNVRRWIETNRAELLASSDPARPLIWWAAPSPARLESLYRAARGQRAALRQARPTRISEVRLAPPVWGLYRIHQATGAWYVGISSNLRNRLYAHQASGRLDFARGDIADLIQAKQPGLDGVVTWADLQEAEREHIRRLRQRGERLVNIVSGGNGNPPAVRFNAGEIPSAGPLDRGLMARTERRWTSQLLGQEGPDDSLVNDHPVKVLDLRIRMSTRSGEWSLLLAQEEGLQVWAEPYLAKRATAFRRDSIDLSRLSELSEAQGEADRLRRALEDVGDTIELTDRLKLVYWKPTRGRIDDRERELIPAQALLEVTRQHVIDGTLPDGVRAAGFEIDHSFQKGASLNTVRRIRAGDGAETYLKVEENQPAVRAELLASLIWYRLGWPGIVDRVIESYDRSVLIVPAVAGVRGITDKGAFSDAFDGYPRETPDSLRVGDRSRHVMRVRIDDLRLRDPYDVIRFVVMNAAWGNSDRHAGNLHYGWEADADSPDGGYGYLLPLDHGRCFFNNFPLPPLVGQGMTGSPIAAVTGKVGNPHQLLRAFADVAVAEPEAVKFVIDGWCTDVGNVLSTLAGDPEWDEFREELVTMRRRVREISTDSTEFVNACVEVVDR